MYHRVLTCTEDEPLKHALPCSVSMASASDAQGLNDRSTNEDYLREAKKLQDKTENSLIASLEMIEAAKKVSQPAVFARPPFWPASSCSVTTVSCMMRRSDQTRWRS